MIAIRNLIILLLGSLAIVGCVPQLESGALRPVSMARQPAAKQTPVMVETSEQNPSYLPGKSMRFADTHAVTSSASTTSAAPDDAIRTIAREVCLRVAPHVDITDDDDGSKDAPRPKPRKFRDDFCALYAD